MRISTWVAFLCVAAGCGSPERDSAPDWAARRLELIAPSSATVRANDPVRRIVVARPPLGKRATLAAENLPAHATFLDRGDGTALFTWRPDNAQTGEARVTFTATAGNQTETAVWRITVTRDGSLDWKGPIELPAVPGLTQEFPVDVEPEIELELVDAPAGVTLLQDPPRLRIEVPVAGDYLVTVRLTKGDESVEVVLLVRVVWDRNLPPVFAMGTTRMTLVGGDSLALPVLVSDPNGDPVALSIAGPAEMHMIDGELRWRPPFRGAGVTQATITAWDGAMSATHTITFEVADKPNAAPILPSFGHLEIGQGGLLVMNAEAWDEEDDAVAYSVSSTSAGVTGVYVTSAGVVSWRVPLSYPTVTVDLTVRVEDILGAASSATYPVEVIANGPPVFHSPAFATAHRTDAWRHDFSVADAEYVSLVTAPTGMTLSQAAATAFTLAWTPATAQAPGQYPVGLLATDQWGATQYASSQAVVENRPPMFASAMPAETTACLGRGQPFGISDVFDPDGDSVAFTAPGSSDVEFFDPPTGGTFLFTDYTRPHAGNAITLRGADPYGAFAGATKSYDAVHGWRSSASVPNIIRYQALTAGTTHAFMAVAGSAVNGVDGVVLAWHDGYGASGVQTIYAALVDSEGCVAWGPVSLDTRTGYTKELNSVQVAGGLALAYWKTDKKDPVGSGCLSYGSGYDAAVVTGVRLSDGAVIGNTCVVQVFGDLDFLGFTAAPSPSLNWVATASGASNAKVHRVTVADEQIAVSTVDSLSNVDSAQFKMAQGANGNLYTVWYDTAYPESYKTSARRPNGTAPYLNRAIAIGAPSRVVALGGDVSSAVFSGTEQYVIGSTGSIISTQTVATYYDLAVAPGGNTIYYADTLWVTGGGRSWLYAPSGGVYHPSIRLIGIDASRLAVYWQQTNGGATSAYVRFLDAIDGSMGAPVDVTPWYYPFAMAPLGSSIVVAWPPAAGKNAANQNLYSLALGLVTADGSLR